MRSWHSRIRIDPNVCHGQAFIRGTHIPVSQIVRMLANGDTIDGLLEDYPSLEREDILAALDYAGMIRSSTAPMKRSASGSHVRTVSGSGW